MERVVLEEVLESQGSEARLELDFGAEARTKLKRCTGFSLHYGGIDREQQA